MSEWFPRSATYFDAISQDDSLSLDVEYDETFEDTLGGTFPMVTAVNRISGLFRGLKRRAA